MIDPARTQTWNLLIRGMMPYPLGDWAVYSTVNNLIILYVSCYMLL